MGRGLLLRKRRLDRPPCTGDGPEIPARSPDPTDPSIAAAGRARERERDSPGGEGGEASEEGLDHGFFLRGMMRPSVPVEISGGSILVVLGLFRCCCRR